MENKKLAQEEIDKLVNLQSKNRAVLLELGSLEASKLALYGYYNQVKDEERTFGKELSEKYGEGTIDLEKGEFIPNSEIAE
jgi:hypothetical protein